MEKPSHICSSKSEEDLLIRQEASAMRQKKLVTLLFFLLIISLVCRDAISVSASASLDSFYTARRAGGEWGMTTTYHNKQVAPPVDKTADQEETQNTSNMEAEDIVYNIDYHGATTHPTPTPKHPTP